MSEANAISTIQLGVTTKEALTHLTELRAGFRSLRDEMVEFSKIGTSADALKMQTASAAGAIEQLTRELNKSRNEVTALKNQLLQLSSVEQQMATRGIQTYMDAEKTKTKSAEDGARKRKQIAKDEADESIKYRKGQTVHHDGFKLGMSTVSSAAEFEAAKKAADAQDVINKAHEEALREKSIRENQQYRLHQLRADAAVAAEKAALAELAKAHAEALREKSLREKQQLDLHLMRVKEAAVAEAAARRSTILDNNFNTGSLRSQVGVVGKAAGLVDRGESDLAKELYGPVAVANVGSLADMKEKLAQATVKVGSTSKEATTHVRQHTEAMRDMHSAARGVAGGFHEMWLTWGNIGPLLAGFAVAASVREAVKGFVDLQYQMTFVRSLSGDTSMSVGELADHIHELSAELGMMPKDAGQGLRALAQAGLSAQESLFALPTAAKMAVVGETTVGEAAQSLTGIMNAFGKSVGQIESISDTIVKAAATSNASIVSMTEAMKMAAPTAKQFNVSLEETSMILTAMAKSNITGTAAGTATKNMIKEMAAPTTQAVRDMMKDVLGGFSAFSSEGVLKPITQQVEELRQQLEGFDRESQAAILVRMFGERGDKAFFSLLKMTKDEINSMLSDVSDSAGKTSQVYFDLQRTVRGQWQLMLADVDASLSKVGESGQGAMVEVMREIRHAISDPDVKSALVGLTQSVADIGAAAVKYGPYILAPFIALKASTAVIIGTAGALNVMRNGLIGATAAQAGLNAAVLANPYVRLAGIIATVAAGYWLLKERKETLAEKTVKELSDLGDIADAMQKENDKLAERNRLRGEGIKLADLENQVTLTDAQKQVASLEAQVQAKKAFIAGERTKLPGKRDTAGIQASERDLAVAEPGLLAAKGNLTAIETAVERGKKIRMQSIALDARDEAEAKLAAENALKAGSKHYIPTDTNGSRGAAALAKAENNAILEAYRHAEQLARDHYTNDIKIADAYYKEGLTETNEYLQARQAAQEKYSVAQQAAETTARDAISKVKVPDDRKDIAKQLDTDITKIDNKAKEQAAQEALNESQRVQLDLVRELGAARKYAEETVPAIDNAQKRRQALDLEAYSLSLLTAEEQNVLRARQQVAEEYRRSEDDILQRLALVDLEIARNMALLNSEQLTAEQRKAAAEAMSADLQKQKALQDSLSLNKSSSSKGQDRAGNVAKQINDQNKWNLTLQRSLDLAGKMEGAFGKVGKAVGGLTVAYTKYGKSQDDIQKALTKRLSLAKTETEISDANKEASIANGQATMSMYGDMLGATKNFFNEKSKTYQRMQALENAFRMVEVAYATEAFLRKTGLLTAFTAMFTTAKATEVTVEAATVAPTVAAETTKATASGITAFAKTVASLPFPLNIAAGAAVVALLVGMGVKMAGGGGGGAGGMSVSEERQKYNGTGFKNGSEAYDWELQKSESISGSLEILTDNSDLALRHSSGMLTALHSIKDGIAGMANFVLQTAGLRGTRADEARFGVGTIRGDAGGLAKIPLVGGVVGKLFGSKTTVSLEDSGIYFGGGQSVGSIMDSGVNASGYADIKKTKKKWYGSKKSSTWTEYSQLDDGLLDQIGLTVRGLNDSIVEAAEALGQNGGLIEERLRTFGIDLGKISLKGLKPDEIASELEAAFGKLGDNMAEFAVAGLDDFQKAGEGYYETLIRVASGVEMAQYQLELLGIAAVGYNDIVNKQGDVGVEMLRTSILNQEAAVGMRDLVENITGDVNEMVATYRDLMEVRTQMNAMGVNGDALSQAVLRGAGGLERLRDGVNAYFSEFMKDEEQAAAKTTLLQAEFSKLGETMPLTKQGFSDMVKGIDLSTEAGQKLYGQLIVLSEQFADLADEAGNVMPAAAAKQMGAIRQLIASTEKWLDISKQAKSLLDDIDDAINGTANRTQRINELWGMMSGNVSPEQQLELAGELKDLLLEKYELEKENAQSLIDLGKSLQDYVKDLRLGDLSPLTLGEKLATATSEYQITLAKARAGDINALEDLSGKADSYLELARSFYASSTEYTDIFNAVAGTLDGLGASSQSSGQTQLGVATSQLSELQQLRERVVGLSEMANNQYLDQLQRLDAELIALNGIYDSLGLLSTVPDILRGLPAEIAGALTVTVASTAVDGSHAGGLTYVPFDGYVAELHKGERVLTAAESKVYEADDKYAAVVAELQAVRQELAELRREQHQQTGDVIRSHYDATDRAAEKVVDGQKEAADNLAWREKSKAELV